MRDGFSGVPTAVDDGAEAAGVDSAFARDSCCGDEQMTEQRGVVRFRVAEACDDAFGNDEDVDGSLRIDVFNGEALIVFKDDFRRDFSVGDFLKQRFHGGKLRDYGRAFMKYKVTLNGRTYEVEVEAGKAMLLDEYEAIVPSAPAAPVAEVAAPGTAGQLKLHDVNPKTAAMIMAIVADKMGKPLNELRFISIKEVK